MRFYFLRAAGNDSLTTNDNRCFQAAGNLIIHLDSPISIDAGDAPAENNNIIHEWINKNVCSHDITINEAGELISPGEIIAIAAWSLAACAIPN